MSGSSLLIIFVFFIIVFFINNKDKSKKAALLLAFTSFVFLFVDRGFFINTSFLRIDNWQGIMLLDLMFFLFNKKIFISKRVLLFIIGLSFNVFALLLFPKSSECVVGPSGDYALILGGFSNYISPHINKISMFLYFLFSLNMINIYSFLFSIKKKDFGYFINMFSNFTKALLFICAFEFVTKNILDSDVYITLTENFFGQSASTMDFLLKRGNLYVLTGLNRECAHLANSLSYGIISFIVLFIIDKRKKKINLFFTFFGIVILLLTGAFSSIISLILIAFVTVLFNFLFMYIVKGYKLSKILKRYAVALLIFAPLGIIALTTFFGKFDYLTSRFSNVFIVVQKSLNNDISYFNALPFIDSNSTRIFSVIDSLRNFLRYPIFGTGLGTTFCHGPTAMALCETGIFVFLCYLVCICFPFCINKITKILITIVCFIYLLVNLLAGTSVRIYDSIDLLILMLICYTVVSFYEKEKVYIKSVIL